MDITPTAGIDLDALRAAQTQRGLDAINRFTDLSLELATLIVADAKTPAEPTAKPAPKPHHAADLDRLFRGVRRAVLVSQKLLAPPKPERAAPERATPERATRAAKPEPPKAPREHTSGGGKYPYPYFGRRDEEDTPDRPDSLDADPPAPRRRMTEDEQILDICREYNIKAAPGTVPLLDRPLRDVELLSYRVGEAISSALLPLGLLNAHGEFPDLPPQHDTS